MSLLGVNSIFLKICTHFYVHSFSPGICVQILIKNELTPCYRIFGKKSTLILKIEKLEKMPCFLFGTTIFQELYVVIVMESCEKLNAHSTPKRFNPHFRHNLFIRQILKGKMTTQIYSTLKSNKS